MQRYYLNELPDVPDAPLGLSILSLIGRTESQAADAARELVLRAKTGIRDTALRSDLIELIETVIIYKLRRFSREEIQAMLQISDLRETRVYQEALEEGAKEKAARAIVNMSAKNVPAEDIAAFLEVDLDFVRQVQQERIDAGSKSI